MKLLFATIAISAILSSCHFTGRDRVRGNGDVKTEQRDEHDFQGLEVSGAIKVYVKQDSAYSVRIETDANLQQYVETFTSSNILVIRPRSGYNLRPTSSIKVYVSGPQFKQLDASGASHIYSEGRLSSSEALAVDLSGASSVEIDIRSPKVDVEVSGASTARLTGETKELIIQGNGASHAKCFSLMSEKADVDVSGASGAEVFASVELRADASGASHVRYKGNATIMDKSESGAGSVRKEE